MKTERVYRAWYLGQGDSDGEVVFDSREYDVRIESITPKEHGYLVLFSYTREDK